MAKKTRRSIEALCPACKGSGIFTKKCHQCLNAQGIEVSTMFSGVGGVFRGITGFFEWFGKKNFDQGHVGAVRVAMVVGGGVLMVLGFAGLALTFRELPAAKQTIDFAQRTASSVGAPVRYTRRRVAERSGRRALVKESAQGIREGSEVEERQAEKAEYDTEEERQSILRSMKESQKDRQRAAAKRIANRGLQSKAYHLARSRGQAR